MAGVRVPHHSRPTSSNGILIVGGANDKHLPDYSMTGRPTSLPFPFLSTRPALQTTPLGSFIGASFRAVTTG